MVLFSLTVIYIKNPLHVGMVKPVNINLKTIKHYTLTWSCKCKDREDVSIKQAIIECRHMPAKRLEYIELVKEDHKGLGALFE